MKMEYFKKVQRKGNVKCVTIGKPVQIKEIANRLADSSALIFGWK